MRVRSILTLPIGRGTPIRSPPRVVSLKYVSREVASIWAFNNGFIEGPDAIGPTDDIRDILAYLVAIRSRTEILERRVLSQPRAHVADTTRGRSASDDRLAVPVRPETHADSTSLSRGLCAESGCCQEQRYDNQHV